MKIIEKYKILENFYPDILSGISDIISKGKLSRIFSKLQLSELELKVLSKAEELCELKILELWNDKDSKEFKALCSIYFDIKSILGFSYNSIEDIYEIIKTISLGYLGEHNHLVKDYLKQNQISINNIPTSQKWNERLLISSFKAIIKLVVKDSWKDVSDAIEIINNLRKEQNQFEETFLNQVKEESQPYGAGEILSLYYFAKLVEVLGQYLLEGKIDDNNYDIENKIKYHINKSKEFAVASGNYILELLLHYFEAFAIKLAKNTIWYTLTGVNHWVSEFNRYVAKRDNYPIYELLYPQKESILKGELLNPAHRAFVISLPTSSGKTLIAEYKILQALNEFKQRGGWVAYVVPTKALINQVYARLHHDLNQIGIKIEKASGALEIDGFESYLIENKGENTDFDILVTTYEKLHLLIRQGLGTTQKRPLVLTIVDEAHNIEDKTRGLNLELLLATIKNDCQEANFVLLTPDIPNANQISSWLGGERGKDIHLQLDWWQPNERVIGALIVERSGNSFTTYLKTLNTVKNTLAIGENIPLVKEEKNSSIRKSKINNSRIKLSEYVASKVVKEKSPIIILANKINETYQIANYLSENLELNYTLHDDVKLLRKFVAQELGDNFPLVDYLEKGIAIHSSAIPDEIRLLIEQLMVEGKLLALVSTTTIAQGINFPVSAVIIGSYNYPFIGEMPTRDFWNLVGRVGRVGQNSVGWVGIASTNKKDLQKITNYVLRASQDLLSQLESAIDIAMNCENEDFSRWLYYDERWSQLLQYISHLRLQVNDLQTFINRLEEKLNATLGFSQISDNAKKSFLIEKLKQYVKKLSLQDAQMADATGFSTITIRQMISKLSRSNLSPHDWQKHQLFSEQNQTMQKLVGIMLETYEIRKSIEEIKIGNKVLHKNSIARLIKNWVNGLNISEISIRLFGDSKVDNIEKTSKAIYKVIINAGCWGIAALQKMPTSGIDWNYLSEEEKKRMMNIPAYIYYGVNTDEGVLMRKANVPRSIANKLGEYYKNNVNKNIDTAKISDINNWLKGVNIKAWEDSLPDNTKLSAEEYKTLWKKLNGI